MPSGPKEAEPGYDSELEVTQQQYNTFVHWTERLVDRRAEANRFYAGINTAIFSAAGFLLFGEKFQAESGHQILMLGFPVAGLILSSIWWSVIRSQRNILEDKFRVIHVLEAALPQQPYIEEWEGGDHPEGRKRGFGGFEQRVPALFMVFHVLFLCYLVYDVLLAKSGILDAWFGAEQPPT